LATKHKASGRVHNREDRKVRLGGKGMIVQEENKISVITPVYCPNQHLIDLTEKLFLESLAKSAIKDDLEVIIVDDASPKKNELKTMVEKVAREKDLKVRIVRNEINQGFGKSINIGVRNSNSPYILITNNDIYVPEESIPRLLILLKSERSYGAVGPVLSFAFGHKIQEIDTGIILKDFGSDEFKKIATAAKNISRIYDGKTAPTNSLVGCFVLIPKVVFEEAGRIDKNYRLGYHIESDLFIRVRRNGYKLVVDQSTLVFHGDLGVRGFYGPSVKSVKAKAKYCLLRNYVYFTFKNGFKELFSLFNDYPKK
jgi:GT2 family glycosyltransferase